MKVELSAPDMPDDAAALRALLMAARAARLGCYGVGAVLLGPDGEVLCEAHNEVQSLVPLLSCRPRVTQLLPYTAGP